MIESRVMNSGFLVEDNLMSAEPIETIVNLAAGLEDKARAALLSAIADLIESYPIESSPWDPGLKFSNPGDAPAKGHDDKPENRPVDDIKKLREEADRPAAKPSGSGS